MNEIAILQAIRLKGRADAARLAEALGCDAGRADELVADLVAGGLAAATPAGARLTEAGAERLDALLCDERAAVDVATLEVLYAKFLPLDERVKHIVTSWQLRLDRDRAGSVVNDHADPAYDRSVLAALEAIHGSARQLCAALGEIVPRLERYATRLDDALSRAMAGDGRYVAAPLVDSYHTVWFELHEELIRLSGRQRDGDAPAAAPSSTRSRS